MRKISKPLETNPPGVSRALGYGSCSYSNRAPLEQQMPIGDGRQKSEGVSPAGESGAQLPYNVSDYVESRGVGILSYELGVEARANVYPWLHNG